MYKLIGSKMKVTQNLFNTYKNNIPVFQSVLDGNHEGVAFVDEESMPTWAVLQTPFGHHFVAGSPMKSKVLEDILFNQILKTQEEKQLIVFSPSDDWQLLLESIFLPRKGFVVPRKIFSFSYESYCKAGNWKSKMPKMAEMIIAKEPCNQFCINDKWIAKLIIEGVCISICSSPMVGGGYAEIDIETNPDFRGKGYGTLTALALIEKLLEQSLTPCWSTWPEKVASQAIAKKVGFLPQADVKAWVWDKCSCI